jgi:hypothetical protein
MPSINSLSVAPAARDWLLTSRQPRILHIFDSACNLINERREVLSIVTQQIGNGPFNLVIEDGILFSDHLQAESSVSIGAGKIGLGHLTINTEAAAPWSARPDWERLRSRKEDIITRTGLSPIANYQPVLPKSLLCNLSAALPGGDIAAGLAAARGLAGLGNGLTPAGDDYILGAVYAARIIHPSDVANALAKQVTNTAAPLTTSLSAAWLRAAGRGEVGILWHQFFEALISADGALIQESIDNLLAVGHSSGADALAGYFGTLLAVPKFG